MPSDCGKITQAAARWQDQPESSPLAGSTRQQTVGRINQVADRGDEDEVGADGSSCKAIRQGGLWKFLTVRQTYPLSNQR